MSADAIVLRRLTRNKVATVTILSAFPQSDEIESAVNSPLE